MGLWKAIRQSIRHQRQWRGRLRATLNSPRLVASHLKWAPTRLAFDSLKRNKEINPIELMKKSSVKAPSTSNKIFLHKYLLLCIHNDDACVHFRIVCSTIRYLNKSKSMMNRRNVFAYCVCRRENGQKNRMGISMPEGGFDEFVLWLRCVFAEPH